MASSILTELEECRISHGVIVQGFSRGHCDQDPSLIYLLSLTGTVTPQMAFFFFSCIWPSRNKRGPGKGARDEFVEVFVVPLALVVSAQKQLLSSRYFVSRSSALI